MSTPRPWLRRSALTALAVSALLWLLSRDETDRAAKDRGGARSNPTALGRERITPSTGPSAAVSSADRLDTSASSSAPPQSTAAVARVDAFAGTESATATVTATETASSSTTDTSRDPVLEMQARYSVDEARLLALIQRQTGKPPPPALEELIRGHHAGTDVAELRQQAAELALPLPARDAVRRWLDGLARRGQTPNRPTP